MVVDLYGWPTGSLSERFTRYSIFSETERLSIVIPTLNQGETLEHTLLSIIHQDYQNFEIIVIDGGSVDQTRLILDKYRPWINHVKFGIDNGQSDAINKGFSLATGNIYAWINSDDYYLPGAFSSAIATFRKNENIDVVIGAGDVISKDCRFLKRVNPMFMVTENLLRWLKGEGEWIMQQACFWRSEIWKDSGGVDTELNLLMDVDLWFKFAKLGKSSLIDSPLAVMRYYPEIKTVSLKENTKEEIAYIFARNGALSEIRTIVKELVQQNKHLNLEIERRNQKLISRALKRLGFEL